jgi:acylphosphatase
MTYKLHRDARTGDVSCVIKINDDGSTHCFVIDENVSSYQAYLAWLAEGNVPEPAEVTE